MLPSILIVGAQRGGTTSLYQYLGQHPDVHKPVRKELQYFSLHSERTVAWYRSHFPQNGDGNRQTLEATPYYLFHPAAAARAHRVLPDARILVLLRDPVARAFSHFRHNVGLGLEPLSFEQALDAEDARLEGERQRLLDDPGYPGVAHRQFSYFHRGCYAEQLEEWYRHYDREQVMVVLSEELYRAPDDVFAAVLRFVGLRPHHLAAFPRHSRQSGPHVPPPSDATRAELRRRYAAANEHLSELLGRAAGWNG
ncbi:MAG: sulfotransferase family protein [Acidimicrobiales bacterium]